MPKEIEPINVEREMAKPWEDQRRSSMVMEKFRLLEYRSFLDREIQRVEEKLRLLDIGLADSFDTLPYIDTGGEQT